MGNPKSHADLMAECDDIERKVRADILDVNAANAKLTRYHADLVRKVNARAIAQGAKPPGVGHLIIVK